MAASNRTVLSRLVFKLVVLVSTLGETMKTIIRLVGVSTLLLLVSGAYAQEGRWELLGEANVDGRVDHDRISVTARDGAFRAIQLKVERAPDFPNGGVIVEPAHGEFSALNIPGPEHPSK